MAEVKIISVECRDSPIDKVVVFNDRAEVKRLIKTAVEKGTNEIHVNNVSLNAVHDSVRVDGRGDAIIVDVTTQEKYGTHDDVQSPELTGLRDAVSEEEANVRRIKDSLEILTRKIGILEKLTEQFGERALPNEAAITIDQNVLANVTAMLDFYGNNAETCSHEKRARELELKIAEEKLQKAQKEYDSKKHSIDSGASKKFVITIESGAGGDIELDLVYQVYCASWRPSYDLRVETGDKKNIKITYYGKITQSTGEDWNDTQLILSTAKPCLGGNIPDLGTLEASFGSPSHGGARSLNFKRCAAPMMAMDMSVNESEMRYAVAAVEEQALSTEFTIVRKTSIPTGNDEQRVTIGIVDIEPLLIHECVPSKNTSVFLTASAINNSALVFLAGDAAVYLNNSFVAKTYLKNVSPNERFSTSLGVDTAIKVEYKPAKKYHEQVGIINKSSANVTEQLIVVKNTRKDSILLTINEHLPRSTDEKIKIKLISPTITAQEEVATSTNSKVSNRREGCVLNSKNNLEWTVKLAGTQIENLVLKWTMDHPKEEKVSFVEKM